MTPNNSDRSKRGWLSPLIHLSNNWISLAGVIIVTTATIFWLFLLPVTLRGRSLQPLSRHPGVSRFARTFLRRADHDSAGNLAASANAKARTGIYPADFPALTWGNFELRKLATSSASPRF